MRFYLLHVSHQGCGSTRTLCDDGSAGERVDGGHEGRGHADERDDEGKDELHGAVFWYSNSVLAKCSVEGWLAMNVVAGEGKRRSCMIYFCE